MKKNKKQKLIIAILLMLILVALSVIWIIHRGNTINEEREQAVAEAQAQCKELENSFFDLQMENLQLKNELEKYKRANEI